MLEQLKASRRISNENPSDSTSNPGARSEIHENHQSRDLVEPQNSDRKERSISHAADFQDRNRESSNFKLSQSDYPSRDKNRSEGSGNEAMDVVSGVGQTSKPHREAHEVNSPIKLPINNPTPLQKPTSSPKLSQQKGKTKLKRIAREKGKQAQGEQKANLS